MRSRSATFTAFLLLAALAAAPGSAEDGAKPGGPPAWLFPQDVKCAGRRLTLHEPQVLAFGTAQAQVALRVPSTVTDPLGRASYGQFEIQGQVHVDFGARLFRLDRIQTGNSAFPGLAEKDLASVQGGIFDALPKFMTF